MKWEILEIHADGELITHVRYRASEGEVASEGYWYFQTPKLTVPLAQTTEEMVVGWVRQATMKDGQNAVESRIREQIEALKGAKEIHPPWKPKTFTVTV